MSQRVVMGTDARVEGRDVLVTRVDAAIDWVRKNSVWPMPMGLACCGIELMAVGASRSRTKGSLSLFASSASFSLLLGRSEATTRTR